MVMKKSTKNVLTVPDASQENPHTIMCTHLNGAIDMVRARLYLVLHLAY